MSKKNVSGFVSALGALLDFVIRLMAAFTKLGGTDEQFHELITGKKSEDFIAQVTNLAMKMVGGTTVSFPVFKTITLGAYDSFEAYREAIEDAGFRIGQWAELILHKVEVSWKRVQVDLVKVTVKDLGFAGSASLEQILAKAKELGLELCPIEVGPALRLAYLDQPSPEWLHIGMKPVTYPEGYFKIFEVNHAEGYWLNADFNLSTDRPAWQPHCSFIFVLPRK